MYYDLSNAERSPVYFRRGLMGIGLYTRIQWEWDLNPGTHGHVYTRESTRVSFYSFSVTHRFLRFDLVHATLVLYIYPVLSIQHSQKPPKGKSFLRFSLSIKNSFCSNGTRLQRTLHYFRTYYPTFII